GAEVAALDGVDEQPADRVALVRVVLGCVYPSLGGDRMGAAGAVLEAERLDPVAEVRQRRRGARAGEPGADHDHLVLVSLARADQPVTVEPGAPALVDRAVGDVRVELHLLATVVRAAPPSQREGGA